MEPDNVEKMQMRIAYYSNLTNAWVQTKMEKDKTFIIISAAGIGFLVNLLTDKDVTSRTILFLFVFGLLCFLAVIVACIHMLEKNASYIEALVRNPEIDDAGLKLLDKTTKWLFLTALAFTLLIGLIIGYNQLQSKNSKGDQKMSKDNKSIIGKTQDSIAGLGGLHPNVVEKSQSGATPETNTNTQKTDNTKK